MSESSRTAAAGGSTESTCPNCGARASDRFCPSCGQRQGREILSLKHWGRRVLEEYLSLDGRFPRSMFALLFRPGHLTREWFRGRRVSYSDPLRLFFLTGAMFVALILAAGDVTAGSGFVSRLAPLLVLASIPLVSLVVMLLERSRDRGFVEHLVFTVHLQAFGFCVLAAMLVEAAWKGVGGDGAELAQGPLWGAYYTVLSTWGMVYIVMAFRRAYGDSWGRATLNAMVTALAWSILVPVASSLLGGAVGALSGL